MKTKPRTARHGLLAGGVWTIEHLKLIDAAPSPGSSANIHCHTACIGGSPARVLFALARSGAPFSLYAAGLLGRDQAGDCIRAECHRLHIDTHHLGATPKVATAFADAMTEQGNRRCTLFQSPGANALWTGNDLHFSALKAKLFHLGTLPHLVALDQADATFGTRAARLLAMAHEAGMRTSIHIGFHNVSDATPAVQAALKYADYLVLSETCASRLTGFTVRESDGKLDTVTLRHAAGALLQQGVRELVILHFPEGAFARTRKGDDVWQPAVKLPPGLIAGRNGVGEAFTAGALLGLHEEWEMKRCLEAAVCLAAAALAAPNGVDGIKGLNTSLALGKKHRFCPPCESETA